MQDALAAGLHTGTRSALLTWPTGTGKTWLARQAAHSVTARGGRVIVTVPLRALADEVAREWGTELGDVSVQAYTRDHLRPRAYVRTGVIILTPERLDLITRDWRRHHRWLAEVELVVADEIHLLADPGRGHRLDAALTRLRAVCPLLNVLALSATVGEPQRLAAWLDGLHLHSDERPVPLHWHPTVVRSPRAKPSALIAALRRVPGRAVVFVHARHRAEELAEDLRERGLPTLAHHAGLDAATRGEVEQAFRGGQVRVLIATPTLELGLNLPCEHVVLYDLTRMDGARGVPLSGVSAWQRAGRAGRVWGGPDGHVTVIGTAQEDPHGYLTPDFEPLTSPLGGEAQAQDFLLGCVDGHLGCTRRQLRRVAAGSFAAHTGTLDVDTALDALEADGGVSVDERGRYTVTPLGQVASRALLPLRVVTAAREIGEDDTAFDVLLRAVQAAGPLNLGVPYREDGEYTWGRTLDATLATVPSLRLDAGEHATRAELLGAVLLHSTCHNLEREVADVYGLYPATLTALREGAGRVVEAWAAWRPEWPRLRLVTAMLRSALDPGGASLTLLDGVGGVTARALRVCGMGDLEALAQANGADLRAAGVGRERGERLVCAAQALIKALDTDPTRERPPSPRRPAPLYTVGQEVDPVRLGRAVFLHVTPLEPGRWRVTGGAAEHEVVGENCDCPDHARTRLCKHVLAVRLARGDPELHALAAAVIGVRVA
nr:DEAD/DEAH box helicase [Deinococcus sp. DB0503]